MISTYFKPGVNYRSWADRFSSFWTFSLFLVLALVVAIRHHNGSNVECFTPKLFTEKMVQYVNERCWAARQLNVYFPDHVVHEYAILSDENYSRRDSSLRTLYQWLPLIIVFQALLFRLPDIVLRVVESLFGYGSTKIVGLTRGYENLCTRDRPTLACEMANYFDNIFTKRPLKAIGFMALVIIFVKVLFFVNALVQLIILDGYLAPSSEVTYGQHILDGISSRNYSEISPSPAFPRQVMCHVNLNRYQRLLNYTLQCSIPVNEFNEQVSFFMWIWLLVVCIASGISLLVFIIKTYVPVVNERFLLKYLEMGNLSPTKSQLSTFTKTIIGKDGVILLKMMSEVSSDILVRDVVLRIWYLHFDPEPRSKSQAVQHPELTYRA